MPKSEGYGKVLEHFIFTELRAYLSYTNDDRVLSFFRTTGGQEVDFIIGDEVAVEVKSSDNITHRDLKALNLLHDDIPLRQKIVVSTERVPRRVGDVDILPVLTFLNRLWTGEYTSG